MKKFLLIFAILLINNLANAQKVDTTVFTAVDKMPEFEGGKEGIYQFFAKNLHFPEELLRLRRDYEGIIQFVVEKDGSLSNFNFLVSKDCSDCEKETLRMLKLMPKWKVGSQDGRQLRVFQTVRIGISWEKQCYFTYKPYKVAGWTGSQQKVYYPSTNPMIELPKAEQKPAIENKSTTDEIFTSVEQNPQFSGGLNAMRQYIAENLKYPAEAFAKKVQGNVFVKFVVEKDGSIGEITILKGIGAGCDEEAVFLIKNMPKWKAGLQNGKPIRVYFTMPISFKLR